MDVDLDVRYYVDIVLSHWKAVLVVFLVAVVAALVVSFFQQPTYQATATLSEQSFEYYDVPRLASLDRTVVKLYPILARTDAVETRVISALDPSLSFEEKQPGVLLSKVAVREDKDNPAIFRITAEANSPQKATLIANTWAEQYIQEVTGFQADWSSQLTKVDQELQSAEEALTTFREQTGLGLVEVPLGSDTLVVLGPRGAELEKKMDLLAEHQLASDNLGLVLESARLARDADGAIEDLPLHLLNTTIISQRGEISVQGLKNEQTLDSVIRQLEAEKEVIDGASDQLSSQVEAMQQELAQDQLELERLTRARDMAESAYQALTNELQETSLFQTNTQILARATRAKRVGTDPVLNVVIAAIVGLAGGVLAAFALQYVQIARRRS
jgi:capsular polysaccharide biosynthesis protein